MRRLLVVGLLATCVVVSVERVAFACSCLPVDAEKNLSEADAAFVGVAVAAPDQRVRPGAPLGNVDWRFDVQEIYKGSLSRDLVVEAPLFGASCGLEVQTGDRIGLFLRDEGGRWESNLCSKVAPADLRAVRDPLSASPSSEFPVEALWTVAAAFALLTVALMLARRRFGSPT